MENSVYKSQSPFKLSNYNQNRSNSASPSKKVIIEKNVESQIQEINRQSLPPTNV